MPRSGVARRMPGPRRMGGESTAPIRWAVGVNLRILLEILRDLQNREAYGLRPEDFSSTNIDDYTLMNSHPDAKWLSEHGRSTPRMSEIADQGNYRRLTSQLRSVAARLVVGLGRPINEADLARRGKDSGPLRAIRLLAPDHPHISFCVTGHPSPRAINRYGDGDPRRWFQRTLLRFPPQ